MSGPEEKTTSISEDGSMPIAVVGIACRFPGDATNPDKLWDMISNGQNAHGTWPKDRFNIDAFYHPNPERYGAFNTKSGHFMKGDVIGFDAPFFSITAKEAHSMDPQQRIALELTYEGLENAGIRMQDVAGSAMGCYMATFAHDYFRLRSHDVEDFPLYEGTGNGQPMLANRISWYFDLKGPSFALDTACSSSLVALHLACQSLRSGETSSAIVGGANIMFMPELPMALSSLHFLSPDAHCKSFDASANGYARGEGAAVVILKPLADALRDGNVIRGVIRGTGVNQDGRTPGITVPSTQSQESLIRSTYAAAKLDFTDTHYFEAHGTGTPVGDPLECGAIGATFGKARTEEQPTILVGSVKTNIGHLEAVAGLAGFIKAVYSVEKGLIAPNLWYEKPNPRIDLEGWKLKIPTQLLPWPTKGIRRASINSFGYGGTNAHCIVDDAYHYLKARGLQGAHNTVISPEESLRHINLSKQSIDTKIDTTVSVAEIPLSPTTDGTGSEADPSSPVIQNHDGNNDAPKPMTAITDNTSTPTHLTTTTTTSSTSHTGPRLLIWTSHEQKGTERRAAALLSYLNTHSSPNESEASTLLSKLSYTLSNKRSFFQWRSFAVVSSLSSARSALSKPRKPVRALENPVLAFVFTGQGAQWFGMGRELSVYRVYRESLEAAGRFFKGQGADWDLVGELGRGEEESKVGEARICQPACTAVQVALVELLASWGVRAGVVAGHSSGEIAAAYAKGSITREDAWLISYHRGRLSSSIAQKGAMMAVGLGEEEANARIQQVIQQEGSNGKVVVACINSPSSVTVSGDADLVTKLGSVLDQDRVFNRQLSVNVAYHSPHMQTVADEYLQSMKGLTGGKTDTPSNVRMFSSVTGELIESEALADPAYWVSNLVNPVKFSQALQTALTHTPSKRRTTTRKAGLVDTIVEVGPHAGLPAPIKQILASLPSSSRKTEIPYVSVLSRKVDARQSALETIGVLVQHGVQADVSKANNPLDISTTDLNLTHQLTDIPPVVWNRSTKYWHEPPATKAFRFRALPRHDLLGARHEYSSDVEPSWRNYLRVSELPWIEHHQVQSSNLYPFAGMIVMAVEAARQIADPTRQVEGYRLRDIQAGAALVIPHDGVGGKEGMTETKLQLRPWRTGSKSLDHAWHEFSIGSRNDQGHWTQNCSGLIAIKYVSTTGTSSSSTDETFLNEAAHSIATHASKHAALVSQNLPSVPVSEFYTFTAKLGVQLGPAFQTLKSITSGHYVATCELVISDTAALMPENFEHDHVIHPATLDGVVQMAALAASPGGLTVDKAKIPRFIDGVWVSHKMLGKKAGDRFVGYSESKPVGKNEYVGGSVVAEEGWEEPMVVVEGCRTVALESLDEEGEVQVVGEGGRIVHKGDGKGDKEVEKGLRKMAARHRWGVDVEGTRAEVVTRLLEREVDGIEDAPEEWVRDLEWACYVICKRATTRLRERGLLEKGSKLAAHHRLLYEFMQGQVDKAREYSLDLQPGKGKSGDWLTASTEAENSVLSRIAQYSVDGKLIHRVGNNLDQILAGELEPLQVLREDDLLTAYYRKALGTTRIQAIIGQYVRHLSHKRPLKVLEIGAGTGGTTAVILKALGKAALAANRLTTYVFTDLSSGFFEAAAEDFAEWSNFLDFKVLNIEKDPAEQGFALGEYDLVVASNVLHATSSIGKVLGYSRSLLKPGGVLLLEEITATTAARVPMVVGSLSGWWMGENDGRKGGPLISEERWDTQLREQSFDGIHLRFRDAKKNHLKSLMISVAGPAPPLPEPPRHIVFVKSNQADSVVDKLITKVSTVLQKQDDKGKIVIENITLVEAANSNLSGKAVITTLEANTPFMANVKTDKDFDAIKHVILTARSTLWLTRGGAVDSPTPEANVVVGLARTIRGENPSVRITTLDLDPMASSQDDTEAHLISQIFRTKNDDNDTEFEFALRDDQVQILRLYTDPELSSLFDKDDEDSEQQTTVAKQHPYGGYPEPKAAETDRVPLRLDIKTSGVLDTLQFVDDSEEHNKPLGEHDVEIFVKAIPLNFHDIMFAMGNIDTSMKGDDDGMGVEASGIITRVGAAVSRKGRLAVGDRVVTCYIGSWRTYVRNHESAIQKIPDSMTFEEAASFTSVYAAAIYSLHDLARLQPGETVLIHAASGGFGQAAIVIAQQAGAGAIYATVGSEAKKNLLIEHYNIPAEHILNSRDPLSFAAGIKRLTHSRGVDVVLNSLAGESLRESWLSLAPFGRFIELGKKDMFDNSGLDMTPFLQNTTFAGLNMGAIFNHNIPLSARLLKQVMDLHIRGQIQPLRPITHLPFSRIEEAFRTMQAGKHIGKIVLTPSDADLVPVVPFPALLASRKKHLASKSSPSTTNFTLSPSATYLLPGGLGGLGRSLARHLASHGAKHIVFTSRSGASSEQAQALLAELTSQGVNTQAYALDIGSPQAFQTLLSSLSSLNFPPIRGVVTFAMQIRDVFFENMTVADFQAAVRPKVDITRNLDKLLPGSDKLDFFVSLSSVAGVVGSRGQGNYNAGNTYQDALARRRKAHGKKGSSVCLGIVSGVGFAADKGVAEQHRYLDKGAAIFLEEGDVIKGIEEAIVNGLSGSARGGEEGDQGVNDAEVVLGLSTGGLLKAGGYEEPYWFHEGRFAPVKVYDTQVLAAGKNRKGGDGAEGGGLGTGEEIRAALGAAKTADEAGGVALAALTKKLARAMMMEEADLDPESPANSHGIDSLVAVEIRAWVFKELRSEVSVFEILSNASLASLAGMIASRSSVVKVRSEEE